MNGHSRKSFTMLLCAVFKDIKKSFLSDNLAVGQSQTVSLHPVESRHLCFTACSQEYNPN